MPEDGEVTSLSNKITEFKHLLDQKNETIIPTNMIILEHGSEKF
jgi:hypothetical protein